MKTRWSIAAMAIVLAGPCFCQSEAPVSGPVLGYFWDRDAAGLRPIRGIPGSSTLGEPVTTSMALAAADVGPHHDYALGVDAGGHVLLVALPGGGARRIDGAGEAPDRIAISPNGARAALYYDDRRSAQLLSGLPGTPAIAAEIDLSALPPLITALATSDRASVVLAGTASGVYAAGGPLRSPLLVSPVTGAGAIAFLEDSLDAVIADRDRNEVILLRDVTGSAGTQILAGERDGIVRPAALAARRGNVFAAMASAVAILPLDGGPPQLLPCACRPGALQRLNGEAVFRLNDASEGPVYLLDAGSSEPRLLFVPGVRRPPAGAPEAPPALSRGRSR